MTVSACAVLAAVTCNTVTDIFMTGSTVLDSTKTYGKMTGGTAIGWSSGTVIGWSSGINFATQ